MSVCSAEGPPEGGHLHPSFNCFGGIPVFPQRAGHWEGPVQGSEGLDTHG